MELGWREWPGEKCASTPHAFFRLKLVAEYNDQSLVLETITSQGWHTLKKRYLGRKAGDLFGYPTPEGSPMVKRWLTEDELRGCWTEMRDYAEFLASAGFKIAEQRIVVESSTTPQD